jgi:hypothetical protein
LIYNLLRSRNRKLLIFGHEEPGTLLAYWSIEAANIMSQKNRTGLGRVLLVWIVGLALGVGAGALTARLLIPRSPSLVPADPPTTAPLPTQPG